MNFKDKEKNRFSIVARIKSASHAWRGIRILIRTTHNFIFQIFFAILAIFLSVILNISSIEWVLIVFAIGFVFVSEALNTAIEIDIDLTSPTYHPYAKDTKDVAAAAVALSILTAIIVGLIIFAPKIFVL